jgi:hypothetical protein
LEILLDDVIKPPKSKKLGKIGSACKYLLDNFDIKNTPYLYNELLGTFHKDIQNIPNYRCLITKIKPEATIGHWGMGLHMVYLLRNYIAHGVFEFPEPSMNSTEKNQIPKFIDIAMRLVLLSIQMLVSSYFATQSFAIPLINTIDGEDEHIEIHRLLQTMHIPKS